MRGVLETRMPEKPEWRKRVRIAIERYLRERRFPRLALGLLLILTGAVGFFVSYLLLSSGVTHMWIRYPVAVLVAYGFFLLLLRIWVEVERAGFDPAAVDLQGVSEDDINEEEPARDPDPASWLDWLDARWIEFDEGCLPLILLGVVIGLVVAIIATLLGAPALLAEVFIDAFLLSVLYRRLRIAAKEHWLGTAVRRTWRMALLVALLLAMGGGCLELMSPGAASIGPAIEDILHRGNHR
jgi:hypothetical protein